MKILHNSATTTGLRHRIDNKSCEDFVFTASGNNIIAVAVCDGAGSKKYARIGAELAAKTAANTIVEKFDSLFHSTSAAQQILSEVLSVLSEKSAALNCSLSDLGTTLLLCAIHKDGRQYLLHIGDGCIYRLTPQGSALLMSSYHHTESINTTTLVTSKNCFPKEYRSTGGDTYLICTDGAEPAFSYSNLVNLVFSMGAFLSAETFQSEISELFHYMHDDATVAFIGNSSGFSTLFKYTDAKFFKSVLGISLKAVLHRKKYYAKVLAYLAEHPCSLKTLTKLTCQHNKKRTRKKLLPLVNCGLIKFNNGLYSLNR